MLKWGEGRLGQEEVETGGTGSQVGLCLCAGSFWRASARCMVHGLQARRVGRSSWDGPSEGMSLFRADPSGGVLVCQILGGSTWKSRGSSWLGYCATYLFRKFLDVTVYDTMPHGKSPVVGLVQDLGERN